MSNRETCPWCGNTDPRFIEDNGLPSTDYDYTLLCIARVKPSEFAGAAMDTPPAGEDGCVPCGRTWYPNWEA